MTTAWDAAYYTLLPLAWILELLVFILGIVAAPILFVVRILFHILSIPLRLLARFEALGYYFGVAALCGVGVGVAAHFLAQYLQQSLQLERGTRSKDRGLRKARRNRTRQEIGQQQLTLKTSLSPSIAMPGTGFTELSSRDRMTPKSPSAMMSTAILEEVDSTEGSDS